MTTKFPTKEVALHYGVRCARGKNDIKPEELRRLDDSNMDQFGHTFPIEVYEIENSEGEIVHLGIEGFRDGFALWLMSPASPFSMRV